MTQSLIRKKWLVLALIGNRSLYTQRAQLDSFVTSPEWRRAIAMSQARIALRRDINVDDYLIYICITILIGMSVMRHDVEPRANGSTYNI